MKYYGDIPVAHLEILKDLEMLEAWFNKNQNRISPLMASRGMVLMAHDYYSMDMEEEGDRFLRLADTISPGYFKGPILCHMEEFKEVWQIVEQLKKTLGLELMVKLGFEK